MFVLPLVGFLLVTSPAQHAAAPIAHKDGGVHITSITPGAPMSIPAHLYMPPNPPAPGRDIALKHHLKYLLSERTTNYYHASASQAKNIELVAKRLNGIVLAPRQTFSYHKHIGPYTEANGYGWGRAFVGDQIVPSMAGGVCQGASTLYSALLRTGLTIVERHHHGLTVPYLPPGEDATVAEDSGMDFRFKNNQTTPILITAAAYPGEKILSIAVWGASPPPDIEVHHRLLAITPHQIIRKFNPSLPSTMEEVKAPGQDGGTVDTWLTVGTSTGPRDRCIGRDSYQPSPEVVERGTGVSEVAGKAHRAKAVPWPVTPPVVGGKAR